LRGNLALVGLVVGVSYIFIDHFRGIYGNEPYYVATILVSVIAILLNRAGKYNAANILFVSLLNFIVFLFSASDTYRSGVYIFFVVTSLTAFTLFGYKQRGLAILFTLLSLILFLLSYWGNHAILPIRVFTEEYVQINFTLNFIIAQVTAIAIVYFLIDVNFRSENQIRSKNEQLAKANSELDRFVYSASHDLRAPLSSILGLIKVYELSQSEEEKKQAVWLIQDRVYKLDNFISEILDYSRNARLELKNEKIKTITLVQEVIEGLRYSKNFEKVTFDIPKSEDEVYSDPERLKVILNNLLANSVKYRDPAKKESFVKVLFSRKGTSWSLEVQDNGIGIQDEHHKKIFDMFYRAHENSEGSGLGLYIVKEVVERMGGTVEVRSMHGQGSTFVVSFFGTN
jgi:signal transduction histidine kinase